MATVPVQVDVPEDAIKLAHLDQQKLGAELAKLLMLDLVRCGKVSCGKAAELLAISQSEFLTYMAQHQVSPFQLTDDEIRQELEPMR